MEECCKMHTWVFAEVFPKPSPKLPLFFAVSVLGSISGSMRSHFGDCFVEIWGILC